MVSDIAWSADARRLMFTAGECVVAAELEEAELGGRALTAEEMAGRLVRRDAAPRKKVSMSMPPARPVTPGGGAPGGGAPVIVPVTASGVVPVTTPVTPHTVTPVTTTMVTPVTMTTPTTTTTLTSHAGGQSAGHGKRVAEEDHEAVNTRKRKKPQPAAPSETSVVAPTISLPALSLALPATLPLPSQHSTLTLQVLATTTSPITPITPDRLCSTLVQATPITGASVWSWLGEGHAAAVTLTSRYVFVWTREGILHVITTDGRTAVPAVFVGDGPAAVASMASEEGDRFAEVTVRGKMLVGVINPGGRLMMENEVDVSRCMREDVTDIQIHFVEKAVVKVQVQIKEKEWEDFMYDFNSRCWFIEQQNIFACSYFNNTTTSTLSSSFTMNSMLTVLVLSFYHD